MQLLPLSHQTPSGKRVSVLSTDETADFATALRVNDLESSSISGSPDELFEECWRNFAVMVQDLAFV